MISHHVLQIIVGSIFLTVLLKVAGRFARLSIWLLVLLGAGGLVAMADSGLADNVLPGQADYSQTWQVASYSKDAGISQHRVFDIAFTANGTAWLAADDGLHRFDGFNWELLGKTNGLPSSFLRAVCVDKQGRLWVGSNAGAGTWDFKNQQYEAHGSETGLANANVREIDQDPDGTLWFSCDLWPETGGRPGGLSCLEPGKSGEWKTFHQSDGLPMDYIIGYFRDSTGRQFALTPHGWAQRQGNEWRAPANPGYEAEECVLQMAESRDGMLFAQGEHRLLLLKDGRWQVYEGGHTWTICATREGDLAAVEYDSARGRLWFCLWDGSRFVRASAPVSCPTGGRLYHLREAPDESLWCVGTGMVVRWDYHAGKWTFYPQLPPPMGTDKQGQTWFAGEKNIVVQAADGRFQTLPPGKLMALSDEGRAIIWDEHDNDLTITGPRDPARSTPVEAGCAMVDSVESGSNGVFWILGQNEKGNAVVTRYENGRTQVIASPEFRGRHLTCPRPVGTDELFVVAHQLTNNLYDVARVSAGGVKWLPFVPAPPPMTYPNFLVAAGRQWLMGYPALFMQSPGEPDRWQPVTAFSDNGFSSALASEGELLVTFSGGVSGHSGCALYCSNRWDCVYGEFSKPAFGTDDKTIYVPGRGGVFIRRQPGTLDFEKLPVPGDLVVNKVMAGRNGVLWMGTADGTLCYRPNRVLPDTRAVASADELRPGASLPVELAGRESFENANDPAGFRYSWRIDGGGWSPFEPWPGESLRLPKLNSGKHLLEVRARDADGNVDATPATVNFTVLPEPLQSQPWFVPLVFLVGGLLTWLVWLSIAHVRQIAAANSALRREIAVRRQTEAELERARAELEQRVIERTEKLTRSNKLLKRQIAERRQAEEMKRKLEAQLLQSQKMEAIGTLAGGIAHDFNNILAIILPSCEMVIQEVPDRPDLQEYLRVVLRAADRAKNLVQQILTFSRHQKARQRQVCDLLPAVKETIKLLRSALPSTIQIAQKIRPVHPVFADPTQIHQVVMNLGVNAQHAMEGRHGVLEICLDEVVIDDSLCGHGGNLQAGLHVRLTVRDTGCGIPPENLKRIFDPFYTTKEVGKGTGLGLAVVHGIVQSHEGAILVQSQPGQGTEFQVLLPAQTEVEPPSLPAILPPSPTSNGEHILVVDDETAIIKVVEKLLVRAGYKVTAHADPHEAFADFSTRPASVHLVLTDLTMPGMNGLELAKKIHAIHPDLPVIVATGFGGDLITGAQLAEYPNVRRVVEKPLAPDSITRLIAEVLRSNGRG